MMRKKIDFPPYSEAVVKEYLEDGSILCDLAGSGFYDTDIVIPPGSPYYPELTDEEIAQIRAGE